MKQFIFPLARLYSLTIIPTCIHDLHECLQRYQVCFFVLLTTGHSLSRTASSHFCCLCCSVSHQYRYVEEQCTMYEVEKERAPHYMYMEIHVYMKVRKVTHPTIT